MKTIDAKQCTAIALGRLGENDYTVVRFDVSAWLNELPGAVIGLYNQRPGDGAAYPVAGITVEGGIVTWTVTSAELTQTGEGKCELVAIAGEVVAKSAIFRTMVFDALNGSGEAPEPWEEWQQQLIILKNEAEQAADRAEEAVEHYPRINNGVWEVWDGTTEQWVSTGVQAQGPQGEPGEQGETGEPGPQGETGPQGEPGADGVTFTPTVSSEGVISWTNDGGLPNPQPVNIKGPQGDDYILTAADKEEIAQQAAESLAPALDEKAHVIYCEASGAIASFTDGAEDMPLKSCIVNVEPVQDLHGYDSPWPAGGGKNLFNKDDSNSIVVGYIGSSAFSTANPNAYTVYVPISPSTTYTVSKRAGVRFQIATSPYTPANEATFTNRESNQTATSITITSGEGDAYLWAFVFLNGTDTGTLDEMCATVQIESGSTATAYSPYSNICPITGWTGANVTRTGKNLIRVKSGDRTTAGITFSVREDGSVVANGTATGSAWLTSRITDQNLLTFLKAGTYTVTGGKSTNLVCYLGGGYVDGSYFPGNYDKGNGATFTLTADAWVYPQIQIMKGQTCNNEVFNFQLSLGSTATAYEPYQGSTYDVTFPTEAGTVYGGSLTITEDGSGVLTVDRAMADMGSLVWNYNTTYAFFTSNSISTRKIGVLNVWSDLFKTMAGSWSGTPMQNALWGNGSNATLYVQTPPLDNVNDFMALVDGHQLMYELATPITYTLTPQEIRTLLGTNNIWADTGDTAVVYKADTKMYIDNKFAELQALILEH